MAYGSLEFTDARELLSSLGCPVVIISNALSNNATWTDADDIELCVALTELDSDQRRAAQTVFTFLPAKKSAAVVAARNFLRDLCGLPERP